MRRAKDRLVKLIDHIEKDLTIIKRIISGLSESNNKLKEENKKLEEKLNK